MSVRLLRSWKLSPRIRGPKNYSRPRVLTSVSAQQLSEMDIIDVAISKLPLLSFYICSFPITSQIWWPLLRGVTTGDNWQSSRQKNLGGGSQTTTRKNKKLVQHTFLLGVDCMTTSINLWELQPTAWIPCPVAKLSTSLNECWFSCSICCWYSCIRSASAACS